jgi:hypothetical protein
MDQIKDNHNNQMNHINHSSDRRMRHADDTDFMDSRRFPFLHARDFTRSHISFSILNFQVESQQKISTNEKQN